MSEEIIYCQNSMSFLIPINFESIKAATQATLFLQTLNLIAQLQQKTEKALDISSGKKHCTIIARHTACRS